MNKRSISASIGALILGIQMGAPVVADVVPDENLLEGLVQLDCRLMANDEDGMVELLEENGELLRLIKGAIPECLPWQLADQRLRLGDFKDHAANTSESDANEQTAFAVPSSGPGLSQGFGGGRAESGGASGDDHQY